ncbi:MAG: patatin-like phospholipase family protein, partial [Woeseiaceae bacterium]|nr:patatin-like phospholipase family protein [Woeseiaceae bacterium]
VLRELTLHTSGITDFDELPIPFRAIGTDIGEGERYVMDHGDLALAIRASMSVPGVFAPVPVDGRLIVDGGIVGNLGIDVVKQLGVDVVIAVDVEFPLYDAEELDSVLRVSEQILTIVVRNETVRQLRMLDEDDILIRPDLGTFGSTDFLESETTIPRGMEAAARHAERLRRLAVGDDEFRAYLARRTVKPDVADTIDFVRVVHDGTIADARIETRMELQPGDPVDAKALADEADRLFGLRVFEKVSYELVTENGQTGVEFRARPKSWGPTQIRFGLSLEDDFEGSTGVNIAARVIRPQLNRLGAEFVLDARIGTDPLLGAEFYQPLRADSRIFVAPAAFVGQRNVNAFVNDDAVARARLTEAELRLDIGAQLSRAGEFRAGVFRGAGEARVKVGDPLLPNRDFDTGGFRALLRFDTLDNAHFPRSGVRAGAHWTLSRQSMGADLDFDRLEAGFISAWSRGKNALLFGAEFATTPDSLLPVEDQASLGGFLRLSGLERGEIVGPHAGLVRLIYMRRIGSEGSGLLQVPLYLGLSAEAGNVWQSRSAISANSLLYNGSVFFGVDTLVGPLYLAAGLAERGQTNFYLFIGAPPF